ncbi:MAG TPA: CCA tRNA nucleotidyltransferase [Allosphingosinicella sp.]
MKLPRAEWQDRPGLATLLSALGAAEGETRYVGGCVRDTLLGLPVSDIDLATRLTPDEVIARLRKASIKAVPTGIAHGTVTAVVEGKPVEVTTLRRDVSTDGRRATVAYTDDWAQDAARRDFTINALSADPLSLDVHDYFGGWEDVERRHVRFIGDPLTRIAEDHLRILRFFRFYARFGEGAPDAAALNACAARANDLMALSRERIADELTKLLTLPDPAPALRLMVEHHILKPVIPEIGREGAERLATLVRREGLAGVPGDPIRRLTALLPADPEAADALGKRLRLSTKAVKRLVAAARRGAGDGEDAAVLAYRLGREEAIDRLLLGDGDPSAAGSLLGWERPQLKVGGGKLIALGLPAGPIVAETLQEVQRLWALAGFPADEAEQLRLAQAAVDQALRASQ